MPSESPANGGDSSTYFYGGGLFQLVAEAKR
jgi:hypothetical protein